ncbi:MAG: Gfo/Idh/MocA family protein [Betaproteobacteria bacterium]
MLTGAIIGFGEVARHGHWPAYAASPDVRIAAVVDRTADRRAAAVALDPAIATFASLDELMSRTTVDFVDVCTPPALHGAPMLAAVARGWHVLCEKPFLLDPAMVDEVRQCAARAGVAVLPVHNWKYAPILRRATEILRAGAIGRLRRVEIEVLRLRDCAVADPERPNWRRDPAIAGGGILMDHGWHAVYLALDWFGESPTGVRAAFHVPRPGAAEDEAEAVVTFPSGEAAISLSWNADVRRNTVRLEGERGEIVAADDTLREPGGATRFPSGLSSGSHHADWFAAMLPDVLGAFRHPRRARPAFEEGAACLSIIQQAYASDRALAAAPWS